jgi:hypothetical protein
MQAITEKSDRHSLGKTVKNVAFHARESSQKGKMVLKCFNCQKKGHKKADCWAEGEERWDKVPGERGKAEVMERGKRTRERKMNLP